VAVPFYTGLNVPVELRVRFQLSEAGPQPCQISYSKASFYCLWLKLHLYFQLFVIFFFHAKDSKMLQVILQKNAEKCKGSDEIEFNFHLCDCFVVQFRFLKCCVVILFLYSCSAFKVVG